MKKKKNKDKTSGAKDFRGLLVTVPEKKLSFGKKNVLK